ncbi:MAG TPA: hypothetical protein VMM78_14630 [Thermomicrobiales bacterium]|nr:hypothetical protein [Thermomicrobiales bacterium]
MAARMKTTMYLDPDLVRAAQARAVTEGRRDYEIVEDALRTYLTPLDREASRAALRAMLDRLATRNEPLSDDEAMALANEELHAMRAERRQR